MRVFIGLTEVANCVHTYAKGFRALGIDAFAVIEERAWPYPDSEYDAVLKERFGEPPGRSVFSWS